MNVMPTGSRLVRHADMEAGAGREPPQQASSRWIDVARRWMSRNVWLCPILMISLAAAILMLFGSSFWRALLVALLLACPVVVVWGAIMERRSRPKRAVKIAKDEMARTPSSADTGKKGNGNG